jgi:hypothetical protein
VRFTVAFVLRAFFLLSSGLWDAPIAVPRCACLPPAVMHSPTHWLTTHLHSPSPSPTTPHATPTTPITHHHQHRLPPWPPSTTYPPTNTTHHPPPPLLNPAGGYMRGGDIIGCKKPPSPPSPEPPPAPTPPPSPAPPTPPATITIKGTVPGDLITDLQVAGLIGDPLHELVFKNATLWDHNAWVYVTLGINLSFNEQSAGLTSVPVPGVLPLKKTNKESGKGKQLN